MKRVVIELIGNLAFCGVDKGILEIDNEKGVLVETDSRNGLKVWCPEKMIVKKHEINIPDEEG